MLNFLTGTEVTVPEVTVKGEVESPGKEFLGGLKVGADLKLALKSTPSFRRNLQRILANSIGGLKNHANKFFEDGIKAIRKVRGETARVVFIFDSLERIRGSLGNEQEVIGSVERLFSSHIAMLKIPYLHVVYTVPPWLKFLLPPLVRITTLPTIQLWKNDEARSRNEEGWKALGSLVRRRFGDAGFSRFFDPDASGKCPLDRKSTRLNSSHRL